MVGLDNAGKTTILYQFLMNEVVQTSPTIGSNVEEVRQLFILFFKKSLKKSVQIARIYPVKDSNLQSLDYALHF